MKDAGCALTPFDAWIVAKIAAPGDPTPPLPLWERGLGGEGVLDRAALTRWQLDQLQTTLDLARRRSRFYRERLAGAPEKLASLGDLARLPFTSADDLRADPLRLLCVSHDAIQRIVTLASSGTTGTPKRVAFTRADQELTLDFFRVGMSTFTAPGERVLVMLPGPTPGSVGDLLCSALGRLGAEGILHDPLAQPGATSRKIISSGASVLVATPAQAILLARHPDGAGVRLRSVLLTTDHVPRVIVAAAEAAWGCAVYNHYGMTEMGLGGGVECRARRGYHLREADLLFEIVDPISGTPLPEGEAGEIVFTTLTRAGMPLIRYRTGDAGRFLPGPCPCGTHATHAGAGDAPAGSQAGPGRRDAEHGRPGRGAVWAGRGGRLQRDPHAGFAQPAQAGGRAGARIGARLPRRRAGAEDAASDQPEPGRRRSAAQGSAAGLRPGPRDRAAQARDRGGG
jgi:phenylacetate-CoA ligase